jgi:serine/threonine-protein kinase
MVLPIPLGTVLRQRYLIQQILGQGGFGRTYLAFDQERFNEACVLKELIVPYQDNALIEKSKVLFQREASILYQLQHPQVPRFWAAFEDEQRLFLVQSWIEGETYRRLLSDRKQQQQVFSEAEVLHFLCHLLPVLAYIHEQGIIHRDISPENIILQAKSTSLKTGESFPESGLPVLIDFGAVKEATSHWPLTSGLTRVGKVGYAPPEQLQTGKVSPSSDLYSLAATSLALLTGKEPQTLLDSRTLTWQLRAHAKLSDELEAILQKMLSVYPGDRYQTATDVLAALQPLFTESSAKISQSTTAKSPPRSEPANLYSPGERSHSTLIQLDQPDRRSAPLPAPTNALNRQMLGRERLWRRQFSLSKKARLGLVTAGLIGIGVAIPLAWQRWMRAPDPQSEVWVSGAKLPQSEASRIIESHGADTQTSTLKAPASSIGNSAAAIKASRPAQTVQLPPNKISTALQGTLQNDEIQPYLIKAAQGQIMTLTLEGQEVTMNLLRSNQEAIDSAAYQTRSWTGQLPVDDQYVIQVAGAGAYTLDIAITPLSRPSQDQIERVTFAPGSSGTSVTGTIASDQLRRYILTANQGQVLVTRVLQGKVRLSAISPNGQRIGGSATNEPNWQGRLPIDGDYVIEISTSQAGNYALSFELF